jgi:hypothetical protein
MCKRGAIEAFRGMITQRGLEGRDSLIAADAGWPLAVGFGGKHHGPIREGIPGIPGL